MTREIPDAAADGASSGQLALCGRTAIGWKRLRWILVTVAIVGQCAAVYLDGPVLGVDQGYQIAGARSVLAGRGVSLGVFESGDISKTSAVPLRWWPPLYSVVAAPLLAAFDDPALVLAMSTWAGVGLLFGAWWSILEALGPLVDWRSKLILWLYWIAVAPPITRDGHTGATDYLALGLFSVALACALKAVMARKGTPNWSLAAGCALGLATALRYAYVPMGAVLPVSLAVTAALNRNRSQLGDAVRCGATAAVVGGLGTLLWLVGEPGTDPRVILGSARSLVSVLGRMAPVPAMAFGLGRTWNPSDTGTVSLWLVSLAVIGCLTLALAAYFVWLWRASSADRARAAGLTFLYATAVNGFVVLVLFFTYLSLKQDPGSGWVMVEEGRYYAPVFGLFAFIACSAMFGVAGTCARPRVVALAMVGLLVLMTARVTGENVGQWSHWYHAGPRGVVMDWKDPRWQAYVQIRRLRMARREVFFLHSGLENSSIYASAWAGAAGAYIHRGSRLDGRISSSRPVTVVALVLDQSPVEARTGLGEFIRRGTITYAQTIGRDELYVCETR